MFGDCYGNPILEERGYTDKDFYDVYGDCYTVATTGYEDDSVYDISPSESLYSNLYFDADDSFSKLEIQDCYTESEATFSGAYTEENSTYIEDHIATNEQSTAYTEDTTTYSVETTDISETDSESGVYFGEEESPKSREEVLNTNTSTPTPNPDEDGPTVINWNVEFQNIIKIEDSVEKFTKLSALANNFVFMAETYGKIIISELFLPNKSIKPVSIGGIAGGEKYIVQNILFKFALDLQGIYGGDENAQKAAGHELKGLGHYWLSEVEGLNFPLMAVVKYCGFCLIALSVLPVTKYTLSYGSSDGGKTVHKDNPELNQKMEDAAKRMNLKGHYTGVRIPKLIYGPGDIEGHIGLDGKVYVLDFARTFPPEGILPGDKNTEKGRVLYKLLRPELVLSNPVPLSSDAFTGWGRADENWKIHNEEVTNATKRLYFQVIPTFVSELTKDNIDSFVADMHIRGINLRQMGFIRSLLLRLNRKELAEKVFLELIARSMRSELTNIWRDIVRNHLLINLDVLKSTAADILNLIIQDHERALQFWTVDIKKIMLRKYRGCLLPDELKPDFDLRAIIDKTNLNGLYHRLCHLAGIKLTSRAKHDLEMLPNTITVLSPWDIYSIVPTVKHMHVTDFADMQALFFKGLSSGSEIEAERFFSLAINKFEESPNLSLFAAEKLYNFARILSEDAGKWKNPSAMVELAASLYETAARLRPELKDTIHIDIALLLKNAKEVNRHLVNEKFVKAIENSATTRAYIEYGNFLLSYSPSRAPKQFEEALLQDSDSKGAHVGLFICAILQIHHDRRVFSLEKLEQALKHAPYVTSAEDIFELSGIELEFSGILALLYCATKVPSLLPMVLKIVSKVKNILIPANELIDDQVIQIITDSDVSLSAKKLDISNPNISSDCLIKLLAKCIKLKILCIANIHENQIPVLDYIEKCEHLKSLTLDNAPKIESDTLTGILKINRISSLSLRGVDHIGDEDIALIAKLIPDIKTLDVRNTSTTLDAPFMAMEGLNHLGFTISSVDDVDALLKLHQIKFLNLSKSPVKSLDLMKRMLTYTKEEASNLECVYGIEGEPFLFCPLVKSIFTLPLPMVLSHRPGENGNTIRILYSKIHNGERLSFECTHGTLNLEITQSAIVQSRKLCVKVGQMVVAELSCKIGNMFELSMFGESKHIRALANTVHIGTDFFVTSLNNQVNFTTPGNKCFNTSFVQVFLTYIGLKKFC